MKKIIPCLLSFLIAFSSMLTVSARSIDSDDIGSFIDNIMQEQMEEFHLPNATVAVVADGNMIFEKGYGYANLHEKNPVDANDTLFRIGSTSKLVTWTAVMQLVEDGKLDLHADINHYLDFEIPALETSAPITLAHLLTHTPGFEDYPDSIFRLSADSLPSLSEYVRDYLPVRVFPAGEVTAYSNYGTALAGYIVEQISGMPFSDYVEENIFSRLGMDHSTFRQPIPESLSANLAQAYRYIDGEFHEGKFEFLPEPAGSMSSTASDMAKFMMAYLQNGSFNERRILSEDTVGQMFEQHFTSHPSLDGMKYGFIERTSNEKPVLFHAGSTTLYDTGLYLLPEENIGLFISYSGGNYLTHTAIFQTFMDRYFPSSTAKNITPPEGTIERSRQFLGEYHQNRKSFTTSESFLSLTMGLIQVDMDKDGYLLVNHIGETNRFVEMEPGMYLNLREGKTQDPYGEFRTIVFETDSSGNTMLMTDGPMTYAKAPWYATSSFTFLSLIITVLFIIGTLLFLSVAGIIRLFKRKKTTYRRLEVTARSLGIAYGVLIIVFLLGFLVTGEFDPVHGLPKVALGILPTWSPLLEFIPLLMALIGIFMIVFTVLAWWKGYWRIIGRIHYTLLTAAITVMLLIFNYWNLI